jgi:uncharacterized protein with von Willebrand factor type A (vWA) domain
MSRSPDASGLPRAQDRSHTIETVNALLIRMLRSAGISVGGLQQLSRWQSLRTIGMRDQEQEKPRRRAWTYGVPAFSDSKA